MLPENFDAKLTNYLDFIKGDYCGWNTNQTEIGAQMREDFCAGLTTDPGTKYLKVVTGRAGSSRSVHSFIVIKADAKFAVGDILKAASWAAPARNFARGNLFKGDFKSISWSGVH